jgi:uncharacterized protein YqcC (DUF446 family)
MSAEALQKLDEIEAEMRRLGVWSESADVQAGIPEGRFRNYLDAPTFELWVQALFLPNARAAAIEGRLPARSQAGEIARRHYADRICIPAAETLLALIGEFDELCRRAALERGV